jgi:hypothetical protein
MTFLTVPEESSSHGRSRIYTDNDTFFELKCQRGRSFGELEFLVFVGLSASGGKVIAAVQCWLILFYFDEVR